MNRFFLAAVILCSCKDPEQKRCGNLEVHSVSIYDRKTTFSWQRTPPAADMDWQHASDYCASQKMKLPASLTLQKIMPLDPCAFSIADAAGAEYWTSTDQALPIIGKFTELNPDYKVTVSDNGTIGSSDPKSLHRVVCWKN